METVENLSDSLEITNIKVRDIVIQGDFNQANVDWPTNSTIVNHSASKETAEKLIQLSQIYGLEQYMDKPTSGKSILDLVFVNNSPLIDKVMVIPGLSDHDAVWTVLNISVKSIKKNNQKDLSKT